MFERLKARIQRKREVARPEVRREVSVVQDNPVPARRETRIPAVLISPPGPVKEKLPPEKNALGQTHYIRTPNGDVFKVIRHASGNGWTRTLLASLVEVVDGPDKGKQFPADLGLGEEHFYK